jgi:hypothetical protein
MYLSEQNNFKSNKKANSNNEEQNTKPNVKSIHYPSKDIKFDYTKNKTKGISKKEAQESSKKEEKYLYTEYGIDIPEGKILNTLHGCTCKSEFVVNGEKIKDTCTLAGDWKPWCDVQEKNCGISNVGGVKVQAFDYCLPPDFQSQLKGQIGMGKNYYIDFLIGFSIYFIVFIILIPYFLYKNNFDDFLEVYLPNVDLLATSLSFSAGPPNSWIFRSLYPFNPLTSLGQASRVFINYIALIGVGYLVARRTQKTHSLFKGWSIGLIMLFWTYLIPNEIISSVQLKVSQILKKYLNINAQTNWLGYILCVLMGFIISGIFIVTEKFLILEHHYFADPVINMFKKIKHYLDNNN